MHLVYRFALVLLVVTSLPGALVGQERSWAPIGSLPEDDLRLQQILGLDELGGHLIRTPSSLFLAGLGRTERSRVVVLPFEINGVWNSDLPHTPNDGAMWAGRGVNSLVRAGVFVRHGPLSLIIAPELTTSRNRPFQVFPGVDPERSSFSSPWFLDRFSADIPLRFGDEAFTRWSLGQSALTLEYGPVALGASTENVWWGPGIRNALVLSNNAEGFPKIFLRTRTPQQTRIGVIEAQVFAGGLSESLFFDTVSANDLRSISGVAVSLRPAFERNLTVGMTKVAMRPVDRARDVPGRILDAFTKWDKLPGSPGADSIPETDQLVSVFVRWVFPRSGLEVYSEWSRLELPGSFKELLTTPEHTQGLILGLQWAHRSGEDGPTIRTQIELTTVEQTRIRFDRPGPPDYYTGRAAPQGFTHRGQVLGASVGPGGSSQWLAVDYLEDAWRVGVYLSRVRWANDALLRQRTANFFRHDFTIRFGIRGAVHRARRSVWIEYAAGKRFNYLFQNGFANPGRFRTVDIWNHTIDIGVSYSIQQRPQ